MFLVNDYVMMKQSVFGKMFFFVQLLNLILFGSILANERTTISKHENILSDEMIDEINQLTTTWNVIFKL